MDNISNDNNNNNNNNTINDDSKNNDKDSINTKKTKSDVQNNEFNNKKKFCNNMVAFSGFLGGMILYSLENVESFLDNPLTTIFRSSCYGLGMSICASFSAIFLPTILTPIVPISIGASVCHKIYKLRQSAS